MNTGKTVAASLIVALAATRIVAPLTAQAPSRPAGSNWVEAGAFYQPVTEDFGDWKGAYARAVVSGLRNTWYLEAKSQEAFLDRGSYGSLSNVHTFSDRVYTQIGVGGGSGAYVLPDFRFDGSLSVKLGRGRSVVATVGVTLVDAKAGFSDKAIFSGLAWYVAPSVIAEIGARFNSSSPGGVGSGRGTAAFTHGRFGRRVVTLRASAGTEGYQLTGAVATRRRFNSQDAGVSWRQWIGDHWGSVVGAEWYHNPFYSRTGFTLGVFRAW